MIRDKVREAIKQMPTASGSQNLPSAPDAQLELIRAYAQRSAFVLEALMKLEEEESSNHKGLHGGKPIVPCPKEVGRDRAGGRGVKRNNSNGNRKF
ncbi:MAG: hypothetical protein Q9184_004687 [Pyrenodesmia sp. 2 TL-2023]